MRAGLFTCFAISVVGCGDNEFGEAPHAPLPQVIDSGGPVSGSPRWAFVTFPGDPLRDDVKTFLNDLAASAYWMAAVGEYGIGPATVTPIVVADQPPKTIDDNGIATYLASHLSPRASGWPPPDANTVYVLFYPAETSVTGLCTTYLGYHSNSFLSDGTQFAYAVIPRCPNSGASQLDFVTWVSSHELAEAATDPFFFGAPAYKDASDYAWQQWNGGGGEVGDMCSFRPGSTWRDPELGYLMQRIWSNAEASAGHDPCVPHPSGDVYFQAAPDATDAVTVTFSSGSPSVNSTGLQIPVGMIRTVDVHIFSDAPTDAMTVWAEEWPIAPVPDSPDLVMAWDATSGHNGDTLHLTIGVQTDHAGEGHEYFIVYAQLGDLVQQWPVVIVN
jgi:hypothetical protein